LVAQGEVLEGEVAVAAVEEGEETKQVEQQGDHGAEIVSGSELKDQPLGCPDGVLAKDRVGCVLVEREMGARLMVIGDVTAQDSTQVPFVEDKNVVETLAPDRTDQALGAASGGAARSPPPQCSPTRDAPPNSARGCEAQ
jgi:hypothetical protein